MDIQAALEEITQYYKDSVGEGWESVKGQAEEFILSRKKRWLNLSAETVSGLLSAEFLADRAKDEARILESEAIALGIMSASSVQALVNTSVQNLLLSVITALTEKINEQKDKIDKSI